MGDMAIRLGSVMLRSVNEENSLEAAGAGEPMVDGLTDRKAAVAAGWKGLSLYLRLQGSSTEGWYTEVVARDAQAKQANKQVSVFQSNTSGGAGGTSAFIRSASLFNQRVIVWWAKNFTRTTTLTLQGNYVSVVAAGRA